ncbi:MAG: nucleoside deaminase [Clostridia bacterium]
MNKYLSLAKEVATKSYTNNEGGPFGAVITDKEGSVVAISSNQVLVKKDPTAHAEIEAIRQACLKLDTFDLSGYILYTSCEPCPMCLSAIIWANIKEVYYGCTKKDAAGIGFRDDMIYDYFSSKDKNILDMKKIDREECLEMFKEYKDLNKTIY